MTLGGLYTILSKIIENESKTNPDILDKRVVLSILPCTTNANEVLMCGTYAIGQVIPEKDYIHITNYL